MDNSPISRKKQIAWALALIAGITMISGFRCLGYLIHAGYGQANILARRQSLSQVLEDKRTPEEIREKLRFVLEVKRFAESQIGLNVRNTYSQFSQLERSYLAYNVTACEELSFEAKTWWFPFVGTVPYLGFFDKDKAEALASELRSEAYDVLVQEVPAYSTLGWFDDPLLSTQLKYGEWFLAGLVIHESAHATLWFSGDTDFNESFASFVEDQGALDFFSARAQSDAKAMQRRKQYIEETKRYAAMLRKTALELENIYKSKSTKEEKRHAKKLALEALRAELRQNAPDFQILHLEKLAAGEFNNAVFLNYRRYSSGQSLFARIYAEEGKDWRRFLQRMQSLRALTHQERRAMLEAD